MGNEYPSSQHRIHYPGRRDPEQEAEDKRLTEKSKREALDAAAVETRAALLKHMGKIRPGRISPPSWDTYKNTPGVSGNSAMTDYILRYNAENPQHPFRPEVYTPQARPAAPQSRAMQNTPAVGVQADPAAAKKAITDGPFGNGAMDPWAAMANAGFAEASPQVRDEAVNKRIVTPGQALTASRADASRADASPPNAAPASAPDDTAARQRVLNRDFSGPKPDGRPDVVYGWAGYGGTGRQLVSVPRGEHNGQAYSDARREFSLKHYQDRADAYASTMQPGQEFSAAGFRAWNKANPFNSDMHARAARAYADAATAPRPVAFYAPPTALNRAQATAAGAPSDAYNAQRFPDGSLGYARPGGSPTLTTGRSASATFPNGEVERRAFSDTPPGSNTAKVGVAKNAANSAASLLVNPAAPLSPLDAAKAVAKQNADEKQRKQAAITAEQADLNKGASDAAQAKALTPTGSIQRPKGELDGIPLEPLPNANPDGSMSKASEETIRAMTPQGLGQNVNDDPNSPYRLLAAAGSNPAAPMPSTSAVKTEGTAMRSLTPRTDAVALAGLGLDAFMPGAGLAMTAGAMGAGAANLAKQNASRNTAGSRLYNRTEVSPMDALISPEVGYGRNAPSAIASAQSYQAANPGIKFTNKVDDETLSVNYPIVNSNKEDTGAYADFNAYRKLITTYPEGRSTSAGNQDATIAHELLHGTQPRPMDTPSVLARARETIRTRGDILANASTDAEAGARFPRLNRAWVNAGNSFPQSTDDAAKIYSAFGIHPPGRPSAAKPPQGWDQDPANQDIKNMIKSYRSMPLRKQREFYNKWLPQQPGLASRDRGNVGELVS